MSHTVRVVVDRIEEQLAVLEVAGTWVHWPLAALPEGTTEGAVIELVLTVVAGDPSEARARLERLDGPSSDTIDL